MDVCEPCTCEDGSDAEAGKFGGGRSKAVDERRSEELIGEDDNASDEGLPSSDGLRGDSEGDSEGDSADDSSSADADGPSPDGDSGKGSSSELSTNALDSGEPNTVDDRLLMDMALP